MVNKSDRSWSIQHKEISQNLNNSSNQFMSGNTNNNQNNSRNKNNNSCTKCTSYTKPNLSQAQTPQNNHHHFNSCHYPRSEKNKKSS